jgi:cell division protein FtsI (penicillin-binding protein 3)
VIRRIVAAGWRQLLLLAVLGAFASLIARNLFYWQVTEHTHIAQAAARIYDSETNIPALRGFIFDASGQPLVTDAPAFLVAGDPQAISQPRYDAAKLARVLHRDPGPILALLRTPLPWRYVVIAHQVDAPTAAAVRALALPGIILTPTYRASYPQGALAAAVLGFVNANGVGQYGLEQEYNSILTGRDGSQLIYVDTANRPLPVGIQRPRPAVPGASLVLTIDARIQAIVERRLAAAIHHFGAVNGTAIVMDPHTGAILAMASLPSYDPNQYNRVTDPSRYENLALENYQPGSTFKVISVSAGLDSGSFTTHTTINDPGFYQNYGITVHNWEIGVGWGVETPEKMLQHSANVGMAQFANMEGPLTFYKYVIDRFGMGAPTGIDLPNESPGYVRSPGHGYWQMMDLLTNSYGQGIDVTPLQLVTAVAALANHGWRMRPYVVQRIQYPDHRTWVARPQRVARAVSPATAATMTRLLETSAYNGEAMCALTANYPVAAKTGTATIEEPAAHGLDLRGGTTAALVGWAPANNPRFVMLITVTHPQPGPLGRDIYGSVVAAPAWHDIAVNLYRLFGIAPQPGSTPKDLAYLQGPNYWMCDFTSGQ